MIRHETYVDGMVVAADIIDLAAGTIACEEHGVVILTRALTDDERAMYGPPSLDPVGAAATLNVILGLWSLTDAANIAGVEPERLVSEAQAWAVAAALEMP